MKTLMPNSEGKPILVRRALISVFDRNGLVDLAWFLTKNGVTMMATGGTGDYLQKMGLPIEELASISDFRELLGGRVKSLHPAVHAAILADRDNHKHLKNLQELQVSPFDLVVGGLYPFASISKGEWSPEAKEAVDIGGPAMIRSAAKNHEWVAVVSDPNDYAELIDEMESWDGHVSYPFRRKMAAEVFKRVGRYDMEIAAQLADDPETDFESQKTLNLQKIKKLRYGENPHQEAAFYAKSPFYGIAAAKQLTGPELGYNNIADADAAWSLVSEFDPSVHSFCTIIKHGTPCGAAQDEVLINSFVRARNTDPLSAFGGVIGINQTLDLETAKEILTHFFELVIAPDADEEAIQLLKQKNRIRLMIMPDANIRLQSQLDVLSVNGGYLMQKSILDTSSRIDWIVCSELEPSESQWSDLEFSWKVAKHAKSNAIVTAFDGAALGMGAGQTSRVDATRVAVKPLINLPDVQPIVAASDGFFPFPDGVEVLAEAGVKAIIQPGGSKQDEKVVEVADKLGLVMVFTNRRQFKH